MAFTTGLANLLFLMPSTTGLANLLFLMSSTIGLALFFFLMASTIAFGLFASLFVISRHFTFGLVAAGELVSPTCFILEFSHLMVMAIRN